MKEYRLYSDPKSNTECSTVIANNNDELLKRITQVAKTELAKSGYTVEIVEFSQTQYNFVDIWVKRGFNRKIIRWKCIDGRRLKRSDYMKKLGIRKKQCRRIMISEVVPLDCNGEIWAENKMREWLMSQELLKMYWDSDKAGNKELRTVLNMGNENGENVIKVYAWKLVQLPVEDE